MSTFSALYAPTPSPRPSFSRLVKEALAIASELSGYTIDDILGRRRYDNLVRVRGATVTAIRELSREGMSYPQLGAVFHRDHSSIVSLVRQVRRGDESWDGARELCREIVGRVKEAGWGIKGMGNKGQDGKWAGCGEYRGLFSKVGG